MLFACISLMGGGRKKNRTLPLGSSKFTFGLARCPTLLNVNRSQTGHESS